MSHRDVVAAVPHGFAVTAYTDTSDIAAMSDRERKIFGLQFHPEVVHTHAGKRILENFVFGICGASGIGISRNAFRWSKSRFAPPPATATSSSSSAAALIRQLPTRFACARSVPNASSEST